MTKTGEEKATETDMRVMWPQAKECQEPPTAERGTECLRASREEHSAAKALISAQRNWFKTSGLQHHENKFQFFLRHQLWGDLLQQP